MLAELASSTSLVIASIDDCGMSWSRSANAIVAYAIFWFFEICVRRRRRTGLHAGHTADLCDVGEQRLHARLDGIGAHTRVGGEHDLALVTGPRGNRDCSNSVARCDSAPANEKLCEYEPPMAFPRKMAAMSATIQNASMPRRW